MMHADWLPLMMQGSFNEIYVIDCKNLHFIQINQAACKSLQYSKEELVGKSFLSIACRLNDDTVRQVLMPLREKVADQARLETVHVRKDGTNYPIELRLFHAPSATQPVYIVIGNDLSTHQESAEALRRSEARFRAIVSNTPGLVYQFLRLPNGEVSFPYLSEGCHALLGMPSEQLHEDSSRFLKLILPEDRQSYYDAMAISAQEMKAWNWEGRIWIEEWNDTKWINLRATPRLLQDGSVQWEGIMTNITESRLEQDEIRRSRAQLAELSAHIETVKEKERTRIAREIHDDVGGNLTAIKMALSLLTRRLPAEDHSLQEKADYVDLLIDRTFEAVHRIAGDLRPSILDFGIVAAIDWQAKEFEKQSGMPCAFKSSHKEIDLHLDQATALFRIFQEALTNISKHAQATRVTVRLDCDERKVRLKVVDNGRGIAKADPAKPKSFGLRGMAERAVALGGELKITTPSQGGTQLTITIPL